MVDQALDSALDDLNRTYCVPTYEAFDVAWIAVLKLANTFPDASEHSRMERLLNRLPDESIEWILNDSAVDVLLDLNPPLESILSTPHERLDKDRTSRELKVVREQRSNDVRSALVNLAHVLKRVRNRRAHGFKTPEGPRDHEILSAGVSILRRVGYASAEALGAK
jgi:hypothetical protein